MSKEKTLLIVANVDWTFIAHRMAIAKSALKQGYKVVVLAKDTGRSDEIIKQGLLFYNLDITRSGTNIFQELISFCKMFFFYKKIEPDVVYHVTMKPVIYGTIVSKWLGLITVNGISGLGYNFTGARKGFVQKVMVKMMRYAFCKPHNYLIFENKDDCKELTSLGIVTKSNHINFTKGVGVDLNRFKSQESIEKKVLSSKVVVLLPARMLWDKGVKEFVEAALLLKQKYLGQVVFKLCGKIDDNNKQAVSEQYLLNCKIDGYLEWIGYQSNMVVQYQHADVVVLPSYREGMPTALIEACAVGKPIVTTNAIGCKECVDEGVNGYKVPVKSVQALAMAIQKLIVSSELRKKMGQASRIKAEEQFDQKYVIEKHLEIFRLSLLKK